MQVMVLGLRGIQNVQGGVEKHAEQLYPLLAQLGCQIDVITRSPYTPKDHKSWNKIVIHRLWAPRIAGIEALVHSILGVLYAALRRPDILHIHAIGPAIVTPLARIFGLCVVVTHHGPDYDREKWGKTARKMLRLGERLGMKYSNSRIVISSAIGELVKNKYNVSVNVIPNGVPLPEIPNSSYALDRFELTKKHYILLVSRFVPEKRHFDLINAFNEAKLEGWKLVLVGDADHPNEYSRKLKSIVNKLPNVVLTGYLGGTQLAEIYANAGLFILPSSHEGLPIALLEAMSYGLPIYASNIPANLEVGLPKKYYFPVGDVAQIANLIQEHIVNEQLNNTKNINYDLIKNKFNWNRIATETMALYRETMLTKHRDR